ncbi:MAG TPA: hypothetical protein VNO21_21110, partial [Polyangiaceae bacterium]|nr:hypothetical protein [Polyangiaceae bacterium]
MTIQMKNQPHSVTNQPTFSAGCSGNGKKRVRMKIPRGQLLIDGKWCDSEGGETMPNFDPTTEGE